MFEKAGAEHTQRTLEIAFQQAAAREVGTVVVASTVGDTGAAAARLGASRGIRVIVVTHNCGFSKPGRMELSDDRRVEILEAGAVIHTGTLVLRGLGSAIRAKLGGSEEELVASVLRLFGQGMKVCVEMAAMVADAGLVSADDDIVCVAGTARGADTAVLIRPASSNNLFDMKIREILVKPRDF